MAEPNPERHDPDDLDWLMDPVLSALDDEVDPLPEQWEMDLIISHDQALGPGRDILTLEDPRMSVDMWERLALRSRDRFHRFQELPAPMIICLNEERLYMRLMAGLCWARYRQINETIEGL